MEVKTTKKEKELFRIVEEKKQREICGSGVKARHFISRERKSILYLEGFQAVPTRRYYKDETRVKILGL
jgi:hypothetical protein